jgi:hypothetical protein
VPGFTLFLAWACAAFLVAACATLQPGGVSRDDTLKTRVEAILERRGLGPDALSVIDNVIRHDLTPPPAAPPIVRELLADPLAAANAETLFVRAVPGAFRRFVDDLSAAPLQDRGQRPISPLRRLIDAYLAELAEAQRILRAAARDETLNARALISQLHENLLSANRLNEIAAGYDHAALRRAASLFLSATARFARALREGGARMEFPREPVRFRSAVGMVVIGTPGDDVHAPGSVLIVDPGGNDTYLRLPVRDGALSVTVDLAGDDRYQGSDLVVHGLSAIIDFAGNDAYAMPGPGLGAAIAGASVVLDFSGDDSYSAELFGEGAAAFGLGALVDLAGNDTYRLRAGGQGFGLAEGVGVLWDRAGNDIYAAAGLSDVYGRGGGLSWAQGAAYGYRTDIGGGIGVLRDDAGDDRYEAELYAQGAGYYYGLGLLWDRGGADRYVAVRYAQGAGVHEAVGILRDEWGNDRYALTFGVGQGMGLDLALGMLVDAAGDERYRASVLAQGTATANGIGIVVDYGGADAWRVDDAGRAWGRAEWLRGLPSLGLMLYDPARADFTRREGAVAMAPEAARFGGPFGDAPVRHEAAVKPRCPELVAPGTTASVRDFPLADALRRLAPAFAGGAFDPAVYANVKERLLTQLEASLAGLPRGDFDVAWSLGEALRCAAAGASEGEARVMWEEMERVLATEPRTPFAGSMMGALLERPAPPHQMERILAALESYPGCGVRAAALRLRGTAAADEASRAAALAAARTALRSACWRLQAAALDVLKRLGAEPADRAALPTFLRGAQFGAKQ